MPRALLLDSIKPAAEEKFSEAGFEVETFPKSLKGEALAARMQDFDLVGVRSGPPLPAEVLQANPQLLAIGCYGVGTEHIDERFAASEGIPVFNSRHDNGRSVAELVIGFTYSLIRRLHEHNLDLHAGHWTKTDVASNEVRGKVMGIIGYGNIGQQVADIAERNGMQVLFVDPQDRPRLGNAVKTDLDELLSIADVVSIHVPGGLNRPVIGERELGLMKQGSFVINTARGTALDMRALLDAIHEGRIGGAGLDVFDVEDPDNNGDPFVSPVTAEPKILTTPHIGGSTQEAQIAAARSVTQKLINYVKNGTSIGATNFPEVDLGPIPTDLTRIAYIHANEPGANAEFTVALADQGVNIAEQELRTTEEIGYALADIELGSQASVDELKLALDGATKHKIRTRIL